jgi:plasmid stability protein
VESARRKQPRGIVTARTIRFPEGLRQRVVADAARCGRSFEAHVIAVLRRHYGEDVDLAPAPEQILDLARGSLAGLSDAEIKEITRPLREDLE